MMIQSPRIMDHNLPEQELKISTSSVSLSNSLPSANSNISNSSGVRGPEGQLCESKAVLDAILTKYNHINQNVFKGGANGKIKAEFMMCECRYNHLTDEPHMACGIDSGCINRELSIECPENDCPCGPFCQNRKFALRQYAPIQCFDTGAKGYGLKTLMDLKKGSFIIEYCGEVLSTAIFRKRIVEYSKNGAKHFYFMSLKANEYIDASKKGNISRFMNHSCNPNCELQKWVVGTSVRIGIFAIKDIPEGAELTFDYKFERYGNEAQPCYCGEPQCNGFIGKEVSGNAAASMTIMENEEFSEEEEDEIPGKLMTSQQGKALQSIDQVKDIVKYLMMYAGDASKVLRALNKLLKTETVSLQRKFLYFRGLYLLERCLAQNINSKSIVKHNILLVLSMLPISTKNSIVSIEPLVQKMTSIDSFGWETANLARKLLENWSTLEMVYKIPKRTRSEIEMEARSETDIELTPGGSPRKKRSDQNADFTAEVSQTPDRYQGFTPTSASAHGSFSYEQTDSPSSYNTSRLSFGHQLVDEPSSFKEMEIKEVGPSLAWNHFAASPAPKSPKSDLESSTPVAVTESTLEEMLEAAQRANEAKQDAAKRLLQEESEKLKKAALLKKKKLLEQKKERRALSQSLAGKLLEKARAEEVGRDSPKSKESSKSKSKHVESKEKGKHDGKEDLESSTIPEEARKKIKSNISNVIIKVMSRYKDQMASDIFKDRAKAITKALVEKELRKYAEKGHSKVPADLGDAAQKAIKTYVKEYLGRHGVSVDL